MIFRLKIKTFLCLPLFLIMFQDVLATHTPDYSQLPWWGFNSLSSGNGSLYIGGGFESLGSPFGSTALINVESGDAVDSPLSQIEWTDNEKIQAYKSGFLIGGLQVHNNYFKLALIGSDQEVIQDWTDVLSDIPIVNFAVPNNSDLAYILSPILSSRAKDEKKHYPVFKKYKIYQLNLQTSDLETTIAEIDLDFLDATMGFYKDEMLFISGENGDKKNILAIDLEKKSIFSNTIISTSPSEKINKISVDETKKVIYILLDNNTLSKSHYYQFSSAMIKKFDWESGVIEPFLSDIEGTIKNIYMHPNGGDLFILGEALTYKGAVEVPLLEVDLSTNDLRDFFQNSGLNIALAMAISADKDFFILKGYYLDSDDGVYSDYPNENYRDFVSKIELDSKSIVKKYDSNAQFVWLYNVNIVMDKKGEYAYFNPSSNYHLKKIVKYLAKIDEETGGVSEVFPEEKLPGYVSKLILSKDGARIMAHGGYNNESRYYLVALNSMTGEILWEKNGDEYFYSTFENDKRQYDINNNGYYRFGSNIVNIQSGEEVFLDHSDFITDKTVVAISSNPALIYFKTDNRNIGVSSLETGKTLESIDFDRDIYDLHYVEKSKSLLIVTDNNSLVKLNTETNEISYDIELNISVEKNFQSILSGDGSMLSFYNERTVDPLESKIGGQIKVDVLDVNVSDGSINYRATKYFPEGSVNFLLSENLKYRYHNAQYFDGLIIENRLSPTVSISLSNNENILINTQSDFNLGLPNRVVYFFSDAVTISLSCQAGSSVGCESIKYQTVDPGLNFIRSSFRDYELPIEITDSIEIRFYSTSPDGIQESIRSAIFLKDVELPQAKPVTPEGKYEDKFELTFECVDIDNYSLSGCNSVYFTIDGSTPDPENNSSTYSTLLDYKYPPVIISSDTVVKYFGEDIAGRRGSVKSVEYEISGSESWYASVFYLILVFFIPLCLRIKYVKE